MADNNRIGALFSVEFEDYASVKKKLDGLTQQINANAQIPLAFDTSSLTKVMGDISKLTQQHIEILPSGQIKVISTIKDELGQVLKIKQDLDKNEVGFSIDNDFEKQAKEQEKMIEQVAKAREKSELRVKANDRKDELEQAKAINKEIESSYKARQQEEALLKKIADDDLQFIYQIEEKRLETIKKREEAEKRLNESQAKAVNKNLDKDYAEQQKMLDQMAKGREKSELDRRKEEQKLSQQQVDASNKALQSMKLEEVQAKKLVDYEKQKLEIRLKNIQLQKGSLVDKGSAKNISSKIDMLEGKTIDEVREKSKQLRLELDRLNQSATARGMTVGQKNIMSLGDALKATASKLGIFATSAMVITELSRAIREGVQYVKYLDTAYTDLSITMSITKAQFKDMSTQIETMSRDLGMSATNVMDIARVYANAKSNVDEVMDKVRPSAMLSSVAEMSGEETTKMIQSVTNQFKMMQQEGAKASEVTQHIGDVMVAVSQNMQYDFTSGIRELSEAVKTSGSVAESVGQSMESYMAMSGAFIQQTGRSGNEFATSYRMIASRIMQQKELADAEGVSVEEMAKAEKMLQKYNISIRESNGGLRGLDTILLDMSKKWKDMSDSEKQYVAVTSAGVRQTSSFIAIMDSMSTQQDLYNNALNSTGALMEASEKRADSFEGRINSLTASFQGLMSTLLNSDLFKNSLSIGEGLLVGLDFIAEKFGALPTIIALVVGALTIFNQQFRESMGIFTNSLPIVGLFTSKLEGVGARLDLTITSLKRTIAVSREFAIASRQAGISTVGMGASLLGLNIKLAMTTVGLIATKVATIALQTAMSMGLSLVISAIISSVVSFGKELIGMGKTMKDCADQSKALADSLNQINTKNNLFSDYEKLNKQLEQGNLSEKERSEINKKIYDVKQQLVSLDDGYGSILDDNTKSYQDQLNLMQGMYDLKLLDQAEELDDEMISQRKIKQTQQALDGLVNARKEFEKTGKWRGIESDEAPQKYKESANELKKLYSEIQEYNNGVRLMEKANYSTSRSVIDVGSEVDNLYNSLFETKDSIDTTTNAMDGLGNTVQDTTAKISQLNDEFSGTTSELEFVNKLLEEYAKTGGISANNISKMAKDYQHLLPLIANEANMVDLLSKKRGELEIKQKEQYYSLIQASLLSSNEELDIASQLHSEILKIESKTTNQLADYYGIDLSNFSKAQQEKLKMVGSIGSAVGSVTGSILKAINQTLGISYDPSKINAPSIKPPNLSNGSGSSSSGSKDKEKDDIDDTRDKYYELQNAVDDVNSELEKNRILQESAFGKDKINLMNKEISLLKEQARLQKELTDAKIKEANNLKSQLSSKGGVFDNGGNLINYQSLVESARQKYNNNKTDANKKAYEDLMKLIKEYTQLTQNEIPKASEEWMKLNLEMKKVYSEQQKLVADTEKKIYDIIAKNAEKTTNKKKEELDKQIEMLNKSYDEENKEDEMNKKRNQLSDLKAEMDKYALATDKQGRLRFEQLKKQYEEMQDELNKTIQDNQHDALIGSMEEDKSALDKALEEFLGDTTKLNSIIADAMATGMIEVNGEVISLQEAITDMLKDTEIGFENANGQIKEQIDILGEALELYKQIGDINSNLGINNSRSIEIPNQNIKTVSSDNITNNNNFTVQVEVKGNADSQTAEQVGKVVDSKLKDFAKKFISK